jgi:hypothetical protein
MKIRSRLEKGSPRVLLMVRRRLTSFPAELHYARYGRIGTRSSAVLEGPLPHPRAGLTAFHINAT